MPQAQLEQALENTYESMRKVVGDQKLRTMLLGAKSSYLGESSVSVDARLLQLLAYRKVEKKLFGQVTSLPGEEDYLKRLQSQIMSSSKQEGLPPHGNDPLHLGTQDDLPRAIGPQALADEFRTRNVDEPTLTIAGLILAVAITSAEQIEHGFWAKASTPGKFKDDDFQDIVAEFAYVFLHLCDRDAFSAIPDPHKRGKFLDSVFDSVRVFGTTLPMTDGHPLPAFTHREEKLQPGIVVETDGMHLLNERQVEYSRFKLFAAEDERQLTGTLFWEFGNHVMKISERYEQHNPFIQFEAKLVAEVAYIELIPVFGKMMHESPRKPVGFFRKLFKWRDTRFTV
jgi:hypothetical protein